MAINVEIRAQAPKVKQEKDPPEQTPARPVDETKDKPKQEAKVPPSKTASTQPVPTRAKTAPPVPNRAIHHSVPYLDQAVSPAAAAAIRAVRQNSNRLQREDLRRNNASNDLNQRAAVRAAERYEKAAAQGHIMALYNLSRALAEGRGIKRNYQLAAEKFQTAALRGNIPAMLRLAEMRLAGLGGVEDRVAAQALYYVAAGVKDRGAMRAKALLATHLDNNQLQQARRQAKLLRAQMPAIDLNQQRDKERLLLSAAADGDMAAVQDLLQNGVDANAIDALGRTAVVTAAWRGHHDIIRLLLDTGVEIDAADNQGRTALTWAAINGYPKIANTLLSQLALVDVRDDEGMTPLMRAAWNGHTEIVAALITSTANVHAVDDHGMTALRRAEAQAETEIIGLLRRSGAR